VGEGGVLYPTITVGGSAVGTWRLWRRAGTLDAELLPFGRLDPRTREAIDAELDDIARFEGVGMARRGRGRQGVHTARATPARR
jgi:hypothetical protein